MREQASGIRGRVPWVDFIRSISVFLVVVIHTAGPISYQWGDIALTEWMAGNVFSSFTRPSVSLLFMVSGFLLLNRRESITAFYRNRFLKVFLPFLGWSVLYLVWEHGYRDFTWINAIKAILVAIMTMPAAFHMWFLYELLYIYLFVPVLRVFVHSADRSHLWYFAGVWFVFGPLLLMLERMMGVELIVNLGFITQYIGFFLLGYLLGNLDYSPKWTVPSLVVYLVSALYTVFATYTLTSLKGASDQYYYWYDRINVVVMSLAAFVLLKMSGEAISSDAVRRLLERIARASFGIYLVHVMVIILLRRAGLTVFLGPVILTVPALSLLTWLISYGIVTFLQKIPILRNFVPN